MWDMCSRCNGNKTNCVYGYYLSTIDCPYSQKLGLMCDMNHCDTKNNKLWCTWALQKSGDGFIYCPHNDCPYTLKTKIKCSMKKNEN